MVELHTDVTMMRAGSDDAMVTVEIHHNDDKIHDETKRDVGAKVADVIVNNVKVKIERYAKFKIYK